MNSEFDTIFRILDKIIDALEYIETKWKKKNKCIEIEMGNKTKLDENYIEKGYTLITCYDKKYKKDCM